MMWAGLWIMDWPVCICKYCVGTELANQDAGVHVLERIKRKGERVDSIRA